MGWERINAGWAKELNKEKQERIPGIRSEILDTDQLKQKTEKARLKSNEQSFGQL